MAHRTSTDYRDRLDRVLRHVQANLDEPLPTERLADVACLSPFHFHRLFRSLTGETLGEVVRRLRLERAAAGLRAGQSVISAAFIQGRCSKGMTSLGISMYFSWSRSNISVRLPFQKYVT